MTLISDAIVGRRGRLYEAIEVGDRIVEVRDYPSPDSAGRPFFIIDNGQELLANFGDTTGNYEIEAARLFQRYITPADGQLF